MPLIIIGQVEMKKGTLKAMKDFLKTTRGYDVRSIKKLADGNYKVYLREPLPSGATFITLNHSTIKEIL